MRNEVLIEAPGDKRRRRLQVLNNRAEHDRLIEVLRAYGRPVICERSFEAVEFATLEWVDWFNNRRLLEPIGDIPPAEAEERYYAMLDEPAVAA